MEPLARDEELDRLRAELIAFVLGETADRIAADPALLSQVADRVADPSVVARLMSSDAADRIVQLIADRVVVGLANRLPTPADGRTHRATASERPEDPAAAEGSASDWDEPPVEPVATDPDTAADQQAVAERDRRLVMRWWFAGVLALALLSAGTVLGLGLEAEFQWFGGTPADGASRN